MWSLMNLDGTVQALADRLGHPVIVFDADLGVAAFSVHDGPVDRARLSMILTHKVSERAAAMITQHRVDQAPGAVLLPVVANIPPRLVAALRYRGRLTGYVSYIPGSDDDPEGRDAADIVAARTELAALLAARELDRRTGADRIVHLASLLLDGQQEEREEAATELIQDGLISAAPNYTAMVFRSMGELGAAQADAHVVVDRALNAIGLGGSLTAVGAVIDGEGVLIMPRELEAPRLRQLLGIPLYAQVRSGAGAPRERLVDVHDSRREARIAVRATLQDPARYGVTAMWSELGVDRMLLQLPLDRMSLHDLPPAVAALIVHPAGTGLADTLEAYLDNGADAQQTARSLHIHRSTLYYRLDRIRVIVDADLADGGVRRELHTALRVATLAGLR